MVRVGFLSLCLLTFITVIVSSPDPQTSPISIPASSDLTYSGVYKIQNCNSRLPARLRPEVVQLRQFLTKAWISTKALLADIGNGTNSKYGFGALFKSNSSIALVSSIFRNMRYGPSVGLDHQVPTLLCLHDNLEDPTLQDLFQRYCGPLGTAVAIPGTSYIGFCPSFFVIDKRGLDFPETLNCPRTNRTVFQDSPHPLTHKTYPIFLAQMLRLHIEGGLIEGDLESQVHLIEDCISLSATASLANVANWVNYAACESSSLKMIP